MVRFAEAGDLERINELRKAVNDVHVHGRPDIFKAGFHTELRDYIYSICKAEDKDILVVEREGVICGYACLRYAEKSETPFMRARRFLDVDEFGVDEGFRRQDRERNSWKVSGWRQEKRAPSDRAEYVGIQQGGAGLLRVRWF